jgi:hypothetical protein
MVWEEEEKLLARKRRCLANLSSLIWLVRDRATTRVLVMEILVAWTFSRLVVIQKLCQDKRRYRLIRIRIRMDHAQPHVASRYCTWKR